MNKNDFPTYEENEEQVRRDMQCLHDETRSAFNALVEALTASTAASELGASAPAGLSGKTVQALIQELAEAIGALGGSVELEGSSLARYVADAVEADVLGGYYDAEQVDEKLSGLGVDALGERVAAMENAFAREGVVMGEVVQAYPFTMPGAELVGVSDVMGGPLLLGDTLAAIVEEGGNMLLKKLNVLTRERVSVELSGIAMFDESLAYSVLWVDEAGEYMTVQAGSAWYLVSLKTGVCSLLAEGGDYAYCGAVRHANIVTAVLHKGGNLWFYRRNVAGDNGSAPAITALDTYYESGSANDRVLNVYGDSLFVMLKYNSGDSKLKLYAPADMSCSAEFSTGLGGAYAAGGVKLWGSDCYFLLKTASGEYQAKCGITVTDGAAVPSLTVGAAQLGGSRVIARGEAVVYAVWGKELYTLDGSTMELLSTDTLPAEVDGGLCAVNGAELAELWGGRYIPAGGWLLDASDMSALALRCDGAAPEEYALHAAAGRYFVACCAGRWYLFDSLLRPVWGMVPYVTAAEPEEDAVLDEVDTSDYGSLSKS